MFAQRRAVVGSGAAIGLALMIALVFAADASAQLARAMPNDTRAVFREVNATRCDHLVRDGVLAEFPDDVIQLDGGGASQDESADDDFVTGTVKQNVQTPYGLAPNALQVAIAEAGQRADVEILAVVVKGGNGYNAYIDPGVLPPRLQPDQNYISPWVGASNIAAISHWFVCYTRGPLPDHSLRVTKRIEPPVGEPVDPLPTEYRVRVTCTAAGGFRKVRTFTFGAGGGSGTTEAGADHMIVPDGARCRVRELNTDALPAGCEVRYEPFSARDLGVIIVPDDADAVEVINDCQDVRVRRAGFDIVKRIVAFAPGELPDSFVFDVDCTDGTLAEVTVPASGGPGTPRLDDIRVGEYCFVTERVSSLPPGLQVSYDINGSPSPVAGAARFQVVGDERITVTVTNTRSTSPPAPPPQEPPGQEQPNMDPVKIVQQAVVRAGEIVRSTIEVHNRGSGVARNAVVCDRLPRDMTLVSAPGSRLRNGRICWRIAQLRPLGVRRFTLTARTEPRASGPTTNVAIAEAPGSRVRTARARVIIRPQRERVPPSVTG